MPSPPRFDPRFLLPPYGFVPGRHPHPVRDPLGHSAGASEDRYGDPPDAARWRDSRPFCQVLDLFNGGFYWEAHEGFEHWWKALPATDVRRPFFQGLLRLAAAGVKARQGAPVGVRNHAGESAALLREAASRIGGPSPRLCGLSLLALADAAERISLRAHRFTPRTELPDAEPVLELFLLPEP